MIRHIALFAFRPTTSQQEIDHLSRQLSALPSTIPAIANLTWGRSFTDRAEQFTHAAILTFDSRADLDSFLEHPAHQELASNLIQPLTSSLLIVDLDELEAAR